MTGTKRDADADSEKERLRRTEETLLDMKDTSELMVDLAYSSVFYDSKSIARVVQGLEEEMGEQLLTLQRLILEGVRDGDMTIETSLVVLRVAQAAEVIANSALEICDTVLRDVQLHPVLAESIRTSDSSLTKATVGQQSPYVGPTLREIELESETGMRILAVRRGNRWRSRVRGGFRLEPGDVLIAMGPEEAVPTFLEQVAPGEAAD